MTPEEVEAQSIRIIEREAGRHSFTPEEWRVVTRIILASADYGYMETVRIHSLAIEAGITAIRQGKPIITDTNMAKVGIRKKELEVFGSPVSCFRSDPNIVKQSRESGKTCAETAAEMAAPIMDGAIYVVGKNADALIRLIEMIKNEQASPALVIGFPVGFVNVTESKAELIEMDTPFISNIGRKGGSNIAAAALNALAQMAVNP